MRILVTRPRDDAGRLADRLEARGHDVLIEPLFTIEPALDAPLDLDGVQALLMTSANGARAFAQQSPRRDLRVFAVGDATAETARALGFAEVESAGGDVGDLARLVRDRARPADGALLHAAGSAVAGDLAGQLGADGFEMRRAVLYRAEPVDALSAGTVAALRDGRVDVVLFFSPRTARTFVSLAKAAGVAGACADVAVAGLSPAVVEAASEISWAVREVAETPTEAAMLTAVDRLAAMYENGAQ
jgi:uroporphyrinogen-III synthase